LRFLLPDGALAPGTAAPMPLFAAIVRSPFTSAVLMVEMTGFYAIVLVLVVVGLSAHAVTAALGGRPIYESLLDRECARRSREEIR